MAEGLSYFIPHHGRPKVSLRVPESHSLHICPPACGRRSGIRAIRNGSKGETSFLCLTEADVSGGGYEELVEKAVNTLDRYQVNYCIESFHPGIILWLKKHRPDICRGQLSQNFWRHRGELKGWQAFIMTNLLSNFLTRPDFISFHWAHRMVPAVRL